MTRDQIRQSILRILTEIAPEADPESIKPDESLREQLDVDSIDLLNFVIGLHRAFNIEIPETDYAQLATLQACEEYVSKQIRS
jgi:acyl carrier protein